MTYYHATFNAYLDNIKKLGLIAGINKNWEISKKEVIYLTDGLEEAMEFCESCYEVSEKVYDSGIVVLGIEEEDLDLKYLKPDENWKKKKIGKLHVMNIIHLFPLIKLN